MLQFNMYEVHSYSRWRDWECVLEAVAIATVVAAVLVVVAVVAVEVAVAVTAVAVALLLLANHQPCQPL